jgi:hypothetical protein
MIVLKSGNKSFKFHRLWTSYYLVFWIVGLLDFLGLDQDVWTFGFLRIALDRDVKMHNPAAVRYDISQVAAFVRRLVIPAG